MGAGGEQKPPARSGGGVCGGPVRRRLQPIGKPMERRASSLQRIKDAADWKRIGLHQKYADQTMVRRPARTVRSVNRRVSIGKSTVTPVGSPPSPAHPPPPSPYLLPPQARPLMRGWFHALTAFIFTALIALDAHTLSPGPVTWFAVVTFVIPYWASTALHCVPWRRRTAHDLALALDFLGISAGFVGQSVGWVGVGTWRGVDEGASWRLRFAAWCARGNVSLAAALAWLLTCALYNRHRQPVMLYCRKARFAIVGANMLLLGCVEMALCHDWRLNAALQLLGRVFVPWYFLRCVAVDAGGKGWLPLWDGVWSPHENWHCAILVLHCLQLHAVSIRHDGTSAFVTFLEVVGGSGHAGG